MLSGMQKPKRPRDPNQLASTVIGIAIGEIDDTAPDPNEGKDPAAVALGKRGGKARASKLGAAHRSKIAKQAALARWKKR